MGRRTPGIYFRRQLTSGGGGRSGSKRPGRDRVVPTLPSSCWNKERGRGVRGRGKAWSLPLHKPLLIIPRNYGRTKKSAKSRARQRMALGRARTVWMTSGIESKGRRGEKTRERIDYRYREEVRCGGPVGVSGSLIRTGNVASEANPRDIASSKDSILWRRTGKRGRRKAEEKKEKRKNNGGWK